MCFLLTGEDCKAVLIDIDRIQESHLYVLPSFSGPFYQKLSLNIIEQAKKGR